MSEKSEAATAAFDVSSLDSIDESPMIVMSNGKLTPWVWLFAGPGHKKTIAQANRMARERLKLDREQEQARVNGRKYKAPDETVEDIQARNVAMVVDRLLDWYLVDESGKRIDEPVTMNGQPFPFSEANATQVLSDRRRSQILLQSLEFLSDETAFTPRSADN